jgi:hypothetical protein
VKAHRFSRTTVTAVLALVAALVTACATPAGGNAAPPADPSATGIALLDQLYVALEDPNPRYSAELRDTEWGDGWDARGHDCDTRDLVLIQQAVAEVQTGPRCRVVCVAETPCWVSPYDGRPTSDPTELQIDHLVPVAEAAASPVAGSGPAADAWTPDWKHTFYEDLANLVAVTGSVNSQKSDGDPAEWRPPNRAYWCDYATAYVTVKAYHELSVDRAELDALRSMLGSCPRIPAK